MIAWLTAGTYTAVVLNGSTVATGLVNPVIIPAGQTIQFSHTGSPSWVWTAFRLMRQAGVRKIKPYTATRHAAGSYLAHAGVSPDIIAAWLGQLTPVSR